MIKMDISLMQENSNKLDSYFAQKQVEVLIAISNAKIMGEIAKISNTVDKLKGEISDVRQYISSIVKKIEGSALPGQYSSDASSTASPGAQGNNFNQRCGNYKPGDFSVFKFFYAGNK